jgi:hypothetical protein
MTDTATTAPADLTHVRIVNSEAPVFITAKAALDEMNAVQMDREVRKTVSRASITGRPSQADITYKNGDRVVIRPARDEDRAAAPVTVDVPEMTPRMVRSLLGAASNPGGTYAKNIGATAACGGKAGGTAGALLSRGLIERRTEGYQGDGYYVSELGQRVADAVRVQG